MKTKTYKVEHPSHIEDLRDRLPDTYNRVEILNCVKSLIGITVTVAVGY